MQAAPIITHMMTKGYKMKFINADYEALKRYIRDNTLTDGLLVSRLCEIIDEITHELQEITDDNESLKNTVWTLKQEILELNERLDNV